jgi:hypothetical protein
MIDYNKWIEMLYSNLAIYNWENKEFIIFACLSYYKNIYAFGINIPNENKAYYISMTSPEILSSYDGDSISKKNVNILINYLNTTSIWNDIKYFMSKCIESDNLIIGKTKVSIDLSKIPDIPPDYSKLV